MNIPSTRCLALAIAILFSSILSSCTTGKYKVSQAAPPATVTVAVKQFTSAGYAAKSMEDKGLADFEAIYLPTRLIHSLERTPGISKAYFTLGDTSSTDFVVTGEVKKSDGKYLTLQVSLYRVDGAKVWSKSYNYVLSDSSEATIQKTSESMWNQISAAVNQARSKTKISLPEARAFSYTNNPDLVPNEQIVKDAELAGQIERDRILNALSSTLLPRANVASKYYTKWQAESIPFVTQKKAAEAAKAQAEVAQLLGAFAMGLSAATSINAAQTGDVYGMQMAQQNMGMAAVVMESASAEAAVAENRIKELQSQLARLKSDFAVGTGRQITVNIYGKVITLHGTQEEMLKQFREVVKEKLNKQSTPVVSDKPSESKPVAVTVAAS